MHDQHKSSEHERRTLEIILSNFLILQRRKRRPRKIKQPSQTPRQVRTGFPTVALRTLLGPDISLL